MASLDTLGYVPKIASELTGSYRVLRNDFGDGYSQRAGKGINDRVEQWQLTFIENATAIDNIVADLSSAAGVDVITWTPTGESTAKKWTCEGFNRSFSGPLDSLTITLRQEFDL